MQRTVLRGTLRIPLELWHAISMVRLYFCNSNNEVLRIIESFKGASVRQNSVDSFCKVIWYFYNDACYLMSGLLLRSLRLIETKLMLEDYELIGTDYSRHNFFSFLLAY